MIYVDYDVGDLVWQQRYPGGVCVVIEIIDTPKRFPELRHDFCWMMMTFLYCVFCIQQRASSKTQVIIIHP